MARTVAEIKEEMTSEFIQDSTIIEKYGLDTTKTFEEQFSKVSIESILFYVFAYCTWVLEKLFDTHKDEVTEYISEMKTHSLRWYVNKIKAFRYGQSLIDGTDEYSDDGLTDEDIEEKQVVKYASVNESDGVLYVKVATDGTNGKQPLTTAQSNALTQYIHEVKDAGVRVSVRNTTADYLRLKLAIYYNPMIIDSDGNALNGDGKVVENAIKNYISNLPFDGEYRNVDLIDALQAVDGVEIPELLSSEYSYNGTDYFTISAKENPYSGYYQLSADSTITYIANV